LKRKRPIGGAANGIPRNAKPKGVSRPTIGPLSIVTVTLVAVASLAAKIAHNKERLTFRRARAIQEMVVFAEQSGLFPDGNVGVEARSARESLR
jgi:hypothetical protein